LAIGQTSYRGRRAAGSSLPSSLSELVEAIRPDLPLLAEKITEETA
jgi:hypothetical protein